MILPVNGPVSKLSLAAKASPAAIASGGIAWSETVRLLSEGISVGCHAGMTEVAASPVSESPDPLSCMPGLVGHLSIVDVALGVGIEGGVWAATGSGSGSFASGSGSASATAGSGPASATAGSGSASTTTGSGSASATTGSGSASATTGSGSPASTGSGSPATASTGSG